VGGNAQLRLIAESAAASHDSAGEKNLNGQKLGRKGKVTRARILAAAAELLSGEDDSPVSLSAVARRAGLGMTSLYLYFSDLTELILALLEPLMAEEYDNLERLCGKRWPDEELEQHARSFLEHWFDFWTSHAKLLHLRNVMSDAGDERMIRHRLGTGRPFVHLFVRQMDGDPECQDSHASQMATQLMTGMERAFTMATNTHLPRIVNGFSFEREHYLWPAARLMVMAIRDIRAMNADNRSN